MLKRDRHEYYMDLARLTANRGTCPRKNVGACLVKDRRVIALGYNGAPRGMPHCEDYKIPCLTNDGHCTTALHAEVNCIVFAAMSIGSLEDTELYVTTRPCTACTKLIVQNRIRKVYYIEDYNDSSNTILQQIATERNITEFVKM